MRQIVFSSDVIRRLLLLCISVAYLTLITFSWGQKQQEGGDDGGSEPIIFTFVLNETDPA